MAAKRKLSFKDQRELDALPARIEALEAEQAQLRATLADPEIYVSDARRATELHARDAQIEEELMAALERWETLSA
jgi:ATP-binding cassette subfamily F protein uup